jgi:hypothetical protein
MMTGIPSILLEIAQTSQCFFDIATLLGSTSSIDAPARQISDRSMKQLSRALP